MTTQLKSLVGDLVPIPEPALGPVPSDQVKPDEGVVDPKPEAPAPVAVEQTNTVPLPVFMDVKHENAELRRQLVQLQPGIQPTAPVAMAELPRDPLLVYKEEYSKEYEEENGRPPSDSEIPVSYEVLAKRDAWLKETQETEAQRNEDAIRKNSIHIASTQTMTDQEFGEGLGIDAVAAIGSKYLTPGDKLDISNSGDQCASVLYRKCLERAVQSGTPEGVVLHQKVQARLIEEQKSGVAPAPPTPTPTKKENEVDLTPPAPSAEEVVGRHPTLARLGLKGYASSA